MDSPTLAVLFPASLVMPEGPPSSGTDDVSEGEFPSRGGPLDAAEGPIAGPERFSGAATISVG